MSPWVTILKVLFIAPHFPRPALTPAAFLCFCVRPRKLSFLVYGRVFISLFYHRELDPPKHWGPRQLIPIDGLLIYRAGHSGSFLYTVVRYLKCSSVRSKPLWEVWMGQFGEVGAVKGPTEQLDHCGFNCFSNSFYLELNTKQPAGIKCKKLKKQMYLSRENRGKLCVKSVAQSKPGNRKTKCEHWYTN